LLPIRRIPGNIFGHWCPCYMRISTLREPGMESDNRILPYWLDF
jgi:hypothetical protein